MFLDVALVAKKDSSIGVGVIGVGAGFGRLVSFLAVMVHPY